MRSGAGRCIYLFFILYHIFLILSNRSARTLRENIMHIAGRQNQEKNRIWQDRSGTQSLAAAGGAFIIFKVHIGHMSLCDSFGKTCGHIDLLEMGEILHMGCCGRKFGPGQLSTARRTRQKEKRGAVARLSYRVSNI